MACIDLRPPGKLQIIKCIKIQDSIMVKVRVSTYCKRCGNREITEIERDTDGALAGDVHCGQCGEITDRDLEELI
jgi:hypothetical protein